MEGVAHRGIDAALTSLRRAFYGLMPSVDPAKAYVINLPFFPLKNGDEIA